MKLEEDFVREVEESLRAVIRNELTIDVFGDPVFVDGSKDARLDVEIDLLDDNSTAVGNLFLGLLNDTTLDIEHDGGYVEVGYTYYLLRLVFLMPKQPNDDPKVVGTFRVILDA